MLSAQGLVIVCHVAGEKEEAGRDCGRRKKTAGPQASSRVCKVPAQVWTRIHADNPPN